MVKLGRFHGEPVIRSLPARHDYEMVQKPPNWFGYQAHGGEWIIPTNGLHTDMGSIPQVLQSIIPADSYWSFFVHDELYQYAHYVFYDYDEDGMPNLYRSVARQPVTRDYADAILREGMLTEIARHRCGTKLEAWLIYHAVRLFGWLVWNRHKDGRIPSGPRWK